LIGLGLNPGVQGDRQATNGQSHDKANGKDNTDPSVSTDLKGGDRSSSYPGITEGIPDKTEGCFRKI
jgi:hypothetical protein